MVPTRVIVWCQLNFYPTLPQFPPAQVLPRGELCTPTRPPVVAHHTLVLQPDGANLPLCLVPIEFSLCLD